MKHLILLTCLFLLETAFGAQQPSQKISDKLTVSVLVSKNEKNKEYSLILTQDKKAVQVIEKHSRPLKQKSLSFSWYRLIDAALYDNKVICVIETTQSTIRYVVYNLKTKETKSQFIPAGEFLLSWEMAGGKASISSVNSISVNRGGKMETYELVGSSLIKRSSKIPLVK